MPSQNIPAPEDLRARVLSATLAEVRSRRTANRRALASAAALVLAIAAVAGWYLTRPDVIPAENPNITTQNLPAAPVTGTTVERIAKRPLQNIRRITKSSPSSIARIPEDPAVPARFVSLTDSQLLSALPPDQPIALVQIPDGTARLVIFP